eukprot:3498856-Lingulodinium_polyedra.AAC.1
MSINGSKPQPIYRTANGLLVIHSPDKPRSVGLVKMRRAKQWKHQQRWRPRMRQCPRQRRMNFLRRSRTLHPSVYPLRLLGSAAVVAVAS